MSYCSYLPWLHSVLFLPKDKCNLCFLSWKLGDLVEEMEASLEILALVLCDIQSTDLLDCPLLKSLFRPATREKIRLRGLGKEETKEKNGVICDQEGIENQITLHSTRNIDCLITIQWGTFSGRVIILFKGTPDGNSYCKKWAIKKRAWSAVTERKQLQFRRWQKIQQRAPILKTPVKRVTGIADWIMACLP